MNIPKNPVILLSFINMQLRDTGKHLTELCSELSLSEEELRRSLERIDYVYQEDVNQFV